MQASWCHESLTTARELELTDTFLHDCYLPACDLEPWKHYGPVILSPSGRFIVTDRRFPGRAFFGHA